MARLNKSTYVSDIAIWSPKDNLGKTTLAVLIAQQLCKSGLTAILDLNRYMSGLPFLERSITSRGLKQAYESFDEESTLQQFVQWGNKPLFYMGMSIHGKLDDLYRFSTDRLEEIIKLAQTHFDHVILIVPSNYIESGFIAGFGHPSNRLITVLDEEISNWYRYKSYQTYFEEAAVSIPKQMVVVNMWKNQLDIKELIRLNMPKLDNVLYFPWIHNMTQLRNQGDVQLPAVSISREERLADDALKEMLSFLKRDGSDDGE